MQSTEKTSSAFGSLSLMDGETDMSSASLIANSKSVFQTLSGEGFVLVGYQPLFHPMSVRPRTKLLPTGDPTS
jgi:hypothetical protein